MNHLGGWAELFRRDPANPILTADDWPESVNAVFNPGVTEFEGETYLLVRVEDRTGRSRLVVAHSADGRTGWIVEPDRALLPDHDTWEERWGAEDPRITQVDDEYMIAYTGYSQGGPLVCLASTRDFRTFDKRGIIMPPEDKDAALFPVRFDGRWALIHRPVPTERSLGTHIWLSYSPDLRYWGNPSVVIPTRHGAWWDAAKVGIGPPPLRTDEGWLLLYHGVHDTVAGSIYRLGLALVDIDRPDQLIARGREWVFGPSAKYEQAGDVPGVVFPCGWILEPDGDTIRMYYGAADTCIGLATASLRQLLDHLDRHLPD